MLPEVADGSSPVFLELSHQLSQGRFNLKLKGWKMNHETYFLVVIRLFHSR